MLCQWWLLGVRNEAHDNVPGWVPLCVPHCYGNRGSLGFFFFFSPSLLKAAAFLFAIPAVASHFDVCIELSPKYIMLCKMHLHVSHANTAVYGRRTKRGPAVYFPPPHSCFISWVPPSFTAAAAVQRSQGEAEGKKMNWHKRSFDCLIFCPLSFQGGVAWKEV